MSASRTQMEMSAPEQPSVISESFPKSSSVRQCGVSPCVFVDVWGSCLLIVSVRCQDHHKQPTNDNQRPNPTSQAHAPG